jgi:hypothetical protein
MPQNRRPGNQCDLLAGQILSDGPIKMIQSDRPGGEQTRR